MIQGRQTTFKHDDIATPSQEDGQAIMQASEIPATRLHDQTDRKEDNAVGLQTTDAKQKLSVSTHSLEEYKRRSKVIEELVDLYDQYEAEKNTKDNVTFRNNFERHFEENFDGADGWLMDAFDLDREFIIKSILKETHNRYKETKNFLDRAEEIMTSAFQVNIHYQTLKGDLDEVENIEQIMFTANALMKETISRTLNYLKEVAWKSQFKVDVDYILTNSQNSSDLTNIIYKNLTFSYPFRSWFVVIYNSTTVSSICTDDLYYLRFFKGKDIWVFQAPQNRTLNRKYAASILAKIPDSIYTYWKCYNHMQEIVQESTYKCSGKILPLFSVYTGEMPQIAADQPAVLTKQVSRGRWFGFCESRYYIVIFV